MRNPMLDKDFLDKLQTDIIEEMSLVFEISLEESKELLEKSLI